MLRACDSSGRLYVTGMHRPVSSFLQLIQAVLLAVALVFSAFGAPAQASGTPSTVQISLAPEPSAMSVLEDCDGHSMGADISSACHSAAGCQATADLPDSGALGIDLASVAMAIPLDARARSLALRPLAQPPK